MDALNHFLEIVNAVLWHQYTLFAIVITGLVFTIWSRVSQLRSLTHGVSVLKGNYDDPNDPGAISHFQALSAALSATVGLGNIGGVAIAIAIGGPGAIFWMWIVGVLGMAIKLTEVTLSMLYRNLDDPHEPHGGPMYVVSKGLAAMNPSLAGVGQFLGGLFCVTLLISTVTGANMFQVWNVANLTQEYFGVPGVVTGILLAVIVGSVIIGGITRIGHVAGKLVPMMVAIYLLAGTYVLIVHAGAIPEMLVLIVTSAFTGSEATGAFIGGSFGFAFMAGMKRALFSNEAGQGSSPIAHSAAKSREPVREAVVAGLEPFIDTIVVCTFTALVILVSGVWNRAPDINFLEPPVANAVAENTWQFEPTPLAANSPNLRVDLPVTMIVQGNPNKNSGNALHELAGTVMQNSNNEWHIAWNTFASNAEPTPRDNGAYVTYAGATMTAKAFDSAADGLGKWLVTLAAWLFAVSSMISWSYYGEQGVIYLFGKRAVLPYKAIFCLLAVVASLGFITTSTELDNLTGLGTGVMLFVNLPIMWIFGRQAMRAYRDYMTRLDNGEMPMNVKDAG